MEDFQIVTEYKEKPIKKPNKKTLEFFQDLLIANNKDLALKVVPKLSSKYFHERNRLLVELKSTKNRLETILKEIKDTEYEYCHDSITETVLKDAKSLINKIEGDNND